MTAHRPELLLAIIMVDLSIGAIVLVYSEAHRTARLLQGLPERADEA